MRSWGVGMWSLVDRVEDVFSKAWTPFKGPMPTLLCVVRPGVFTSLQYQLLPSLSGRSNPSVAIATVLVPSLSPTPQKKIEKGKFFFMF